MSITRETVETIADVEVSDDYGVTLRQTKRRTEYSPSEAIDLANALVKAAEQAKADHAQDRAAVTEVVHSWPDAFDIVRCCGTRRADLPKADRVTGEPGAVTCTSVRLAHGFDVAPMCRECKEGKHGACNGQALVDGEGAVQVVPCGCASAEHGVYAAASEEPVIWAGRGSVRVLAEHPHVHTPGGVCIKNRDNIRCGEGDPWFGFFAGRSVVSDAAS